MRTLKFTASPNTAYYINSFFSDLSHSTPHLTLEDQGIVFDTSYIPTINDVEITITINEKQITRNR